MNLLEIVPINKERILDLVDDSVIFTKYFETPVLNKRYRNPLRDDSKPDCRFFIGSRGIYKDRLIFYDFAQAKTYDCFKFIMEKYDISFWDALKKVKQDFNLKLKEHFTKTVKVDEKQLTRLKSQVPQVKVLFKEYEQGDSEYWFSLADLKTLERFKPVVRCIDAVYVDGTLRYRATEQNPIYWYKYSDGFKLYRPFAKKEDKHRNFCPNKAQFGMDQLPLFDDLLIITKSPKDVIVLSSLGYNSICFGNEGVIPKPKLVAELKSRFKNVVLLYDNDGTENPEKGEAGKGRAAATKIAKKYKIPTMFLPDPNYKDVSDHLLGLGIKDLKASLKKMLKECLALND